MTRSLDLPGTDPSRCEQPYTFAAYLAALGEDFWADDPDLRTLLAHHGLDDDDAVQRLSRWGRYVATVAAPGADATDQPAAALLWSPDGHRAKARGRLEP